MKYFGPSNSSIFFAIINQLRYSKKLSRTTHKTSNITTTIRGSSYFMSQTSAETLRFTVHNTSIVERLNIVLNYVDLIWMYSLSNGKLTFPNLTRITTIRITGSKLVKRKNKISNLTNRLERTTVSG